MDIGLYFGSFNPVHHGHLIIAQHLLNETALEQVWMVVSPQNPFNPQQQLLNEYHRLHLLHLALEHTPQIKAVDIEFRLPRPSYTIDTLAHLREKYPQHRFSLIMGSDSLQNLDKWKQARLIMDEYPIYVYRRPGFEVVEHSCRELYVVDAPLLEISATHIRELLRRGKSVRYLLPDAVIAEIEQSHYYQSKEPPQE
ncbi:MAG TPA: nicotinate (nicotinamide) nucleotide adenylyltransferase [Lacibacter sp.]|nr:nicotinate (nicotinamide) nucleotide adenylyltransferase [Lacibacter sp.]